MKINEVIKKGVRMLPNNRESLKIYAVRLM